MDKKIILGIMTLIIVAPVIVNYYISYQQEKWIQEMWDTEVAYWEKLAESEDWLYIHYEIIYSGTDDAGRIVEKSTEHILEWYRDWICWYVEFQNATRQEMWNEMQDFLKWQKEQGSNHPDVGLLVDKTVKVIFFLRAIPGGNGTRFVYWTCGT